MRRGVFTRRRFLAVATLVAVAGCARDVESGSGDGDGGGGGSSGDDESGDETDTPIAEPTPEGPPTHEIGEPFVVGSGDQSIRYTVVEGGTTDAIGSRYVNEEADGRFLVVILRMENVGDETLDITSNNLKLVDEQGREFESDTAAAIYIEQDDRFDVKGITFDQLQPGLEVERAIIFDVPPGGPYALKADPQGLFSSADPHYVPIGTVSA